MPKTPATYQLDIDFRDCLQEAYAQDALNYVKSLDCSAEHLQPLSPTSMPAGSSATGSVPGSVPGFVTPSSTCSDALPPNDPLLPAPSVNSREQQRRRKHANLNRLKKRALARAGRSALNYKPREQHMHKTAEAGRFEVETDLGGSSRAAEGAWIGLNNYKQKRGQPRTLEEYKEAGFRILKWDGLETITLTDKQGMVFGVLCGRPADSPGKTWAESCEGVTTALRQAEADLDFDGSPIIPEISSEKKGKNAKNRRGKFKTASMGVSYGGGQSSCHTLRKIKGFLML
ncbi:hypothetical protein EW026_g7625 [Hermanssonia centrifuga]|uniref:Uncharacterized protein n=1 Tax=Hermanssonia centrifuga TaxID=98765 RepID=A0A4S4KBM2_9APHY|nr:hypothetical protein EW026_g7625 [Hermanssonia centrifuga]